MHIDTASKKYALIVATARDLFWKYGFKRVSVEELCAKANVSKMTFYKFFPNKVELAKAVFTSESEAGLQKFKNILREKNTPAITIKKMVQLKLDGTADISKDFLHDFYEDNNEGLKDFVVQTSHAAWLQIVEEIRVAQSQKIFTSAIKPELLIHVTQAMGLLVTDNKLLDLYVSPHELIGELTHLLAYGLAADANE
ncbi:MAG: TetR/AcrR family transcriptional regulator [Bacteroidota bacterium]